MKSLTLVLGCLLGIPLLHAVQYTSNGVRIEASALTGSEYVVDVYGCRITAAQCIKTGYQPFYIHVCNEGNQRMSLLPYLTCKRILDGHYTASLFLYRQKTRAFLQFCCGLGLFYAAYRIAMAEFLLHGFKFCLARASQKGSIGSDGQQKDTTSMLTKWREFSRLSALRLERLGDFPPWFFTWKKSFKQSEVPGYCFWLGLGAVMTSPFTWLYFKLLNRQCERACKQFGIDTEYDLSPGQSVEIIVLIQIDDVGVFGGEIFENDTALPCATFAISLQHIAQDSINEQNKPNE